MNLRFAIAAAVLLLPTSALAKSQVADPVKISIRAIKVVDAKVEARWTDKRGIMIPPSSAWKVGWYQHSVRPGDPGSAVMYGHISTSRSRIGVFTQLEKLKPGNTVVVTDAKKVRRTFVVRRVHRYRTDELSPAQLMAKRTKAFLNLYTCSGTWSARRRDFSHRFVVTTELIKTEMPPQVVAVTK